MAGNKRKTPELNASSMADIAFLLLIFFLVATTMNTDSGINRVLPPWSDKPIENQDNQIKERNRMQVKVNQFDQILAQGQVVHLSQLKEMAKEFILNRSNNENLPEKEVVDIENLGAFPVSKGVISLQNDRGTSYEMYIKVQNELTRAFSEIRDELATERFGKKFLDLDEELRKAVQTAIKLSISEAEPVNVGGN
mgnify:FL=1